MMRVMPKMRQILSTAFIVGLAATTAGPAPTQQAPEALPRRIDQMFAQWNRPGSPGAAVVVVKDGQVVYQNGYGYGNLDYDIPITDSTVFDIASVSKHFTAFAVAILADQEKLSLDDDVRKHLPGLPDFGRRITVRQLVHHTSGIRDWVELLSIGGYRFDDVIALTDIMTFVGNQQGLNFEPGAEHLYSNTGYNLLAEIVARVSGQPFARFMEENIFRPLGMNDTHILMDHQRVVKNRATSYAPNENIGELQRLHPQPPPADGTWRVWVDNTSAPGSSSVVTSVEDMAKWMRNWETGQVGGPRVLQQMTERAVLNNGERISYAFGVSVEDYRGVTAVSHGGGWRGFRTHFVRFPDQRLSVAVLGNSTSFNAGSTAMRVAEVFLGDELGPAGTGYDRVNGGRRASHPESRALPAARLAEYAGDYFSPELGTTYSISGQDGRLVVKHRKMDDQLLTHVEGNRFVTPGVRGELTYEFIRDASNQVIGYKLRGARFRDVRFERHVR